MNRARLVVACFCLAACAAPPLLAQDAPPAAEQPSDPLAVMRAKESLTDEERAQLRTWIDQRVAALAGEDAAAAAQAAGLLRTAFDGTAAFKEAYAGAAVAAIGPLIAGAELTPATRLIAVLSALNDTATAPVLRAALADGRASVRVVAAAGLRNLRARLAVAGGEAVSGVLSALRDAGKSETSAPVLRAIYAAMDFAGAGATLPDPQVNVSAVLDLLVARAEQHEAGSAKALGAEVVGLKTAAALRGNLNEADQKRYTLAVATLLRYAVTRYVSGEQPLVALDEKTAGRDSIELRNNMELIIEEAEKELAALLKLEKDKTPDITSRIRKEARSASAAAPIKIEMDKWADLLEKAVGKRFHLEAAPEGNGG